MLCSTLFSICMTLCLLNIAKGVNLLKDLDESFPAAKESENDAVAPPGSSWRLPSLWGKADIDEGKTLIDPMNNNSSIFSKFGERISSWQRKIWNPLPKNEHDAAADAEEQVESTESSSWLDKFMRKRPPPHNKTQSVVSDNQLIDVHREDPEPEPRPSERPVDSGEGASEVDQWKSAMPDAKLMENLRCVPIVSFSACLDHCFAVLPAAIESGEDLTSSLVSTSSGSKDWHATSIFRTSLWGVQVPREDEDKVERDARSAGRKNQLRENGAPRVLDWAQKQQLNQCLFTVCARDYLKSTLPGCIDPSGSLVHPSHRINRTDVAPDSAFDELNFYNPHKLSFYSDLGYFRFSRLWSNFFPAQAVSSWLMIPVWSLCLLIMPILIVNWANPIASAQSPISNRRSNPDLAPNVRMCEDLLENHPSWRWVQRTIHTLGNCAELLITFGYSLGFFISGLLAGTAVARLLPAENFVGNQVEMAAGSVIKAPDGYNRLSQREEGRMK